MWHIEDIPNEDRLYFRVHKTFVVEGELKPKIFQERGDDDSRSMSMDWDQYSSPIICIRRARIPNDNGAISFMVGELRNITLNVKHAPLEDNRSHTDVNGLPNDLKDVELRLKMLNLFEWEIRIGL